MDVVAIGELVMDLISTDRGSSLQNAKQFAKTSGGAVANVAAGCARLGLETAFIGKVGDDPLGWFLKASLEERGVDTRGLRLARDFETPIVFVTLDAAARPSFFFHGKPSADLMLETEEVDIDLVRAARVLHFGTVSLSSEPARGATVHAVERAREAGALVSYDPNVRLHMWRDRDEAIRWAVQMIPRADLLKMNEDEAELLLGTREPAEACRRSLALGPRLAVVTLGALGAYFACTGGEAHVPAPKVEVVDTTGAGDAFVAGLLFGILSLGGRSIEAFEDLQGIRRAVRTACAAAALSTESVGAVSALPDIRMLKEALAVRFSSLEEGP